MNTLKVVFSKVTFLVFFKKRMTNPKNLKLVLVEILIIEVKNCQKILSEYDIVYDSPANKKYVGGIERE